MSDPFTLAAQTAAAALGLQGEPAAVPVLGQGWLRFATSDEVDVIAEAARAAGLSGHDPIGMELIPQSTVRRAALRCGLDLFVERRDEHGRDLGRLRSCLDGEYGKAWCSCAEEALLEVERSGVPIDGRAFAAVRSRAAVLHAVAVERAGEVAKAKAAEVDARRLRSVAARVVRPVLVPSRVDRAAADVSEADVVEVAESVPAAAPVASRRRPSSVASRQLPGSEDVLARELARRLGVDYTISSWRALPIVDSRPRDAS